MTERLAISAVLPCFEEVENLPGVVARLGRALVEVASSHEILLVVSERARDGTPELARRLAEVRGDVRVLTQRAADPGYGRALALGLEAARFEWLLLTDADGQFDHAELPRLVALTPGRDLVVGYRASRHDSLARRAASRLYGEVATRLTGTSGVTDLDCAFKLVRARLVEGPPLRSRTGVINAELLGRALARGARLAEVPVTHLARTAGRARFELRVGRLGAVPRPTEAWAIARETLVIAVRRFMASSRAGTS
ncbi:MAG: glycosyltransferase family 2 protein [Sorangiineae bacterium]|nr:glycosyltransferase family 2 protein [Polyangiaceae bacterium]MEB2321835.1 glycosyltransferase family 2 protein [Sorangiineae bacterium]